MHYLYLYIVLVTCYLLPATCTAQIITTVCGNGAQGYTGDGGSATAAELRYPEGVALDAAGNLYIADASNNRIRKVTTAGIIITIAGTGTPGYNGDNIPATSAQLNNPNGVAVDAAGNVYIADQNNNRIRMVNTAGIISTIAGNGTLGYNGDGGQATAAELYYPEGVTLDAAGNLFIADVGNSAIRKVNTSGIISRVAGNVTGGYTGDGGAATNAELFQPYGVAVDAAGNLYIADEGNNRTRMVNTAGIITTIAGNGTAGYSGDGGQATAAELNPRGVACDAAGNLYITDGNNRIRMVNTSGIISTVAGNGTQGYSGDGGAATVAELNAPWSVTFDAAGNLYIADVGNSRIRMVTNVGQMGIAQLRIKDEKLRIYPNPASTSLTLTLSKGDGISNIEIYNLFGECVKQVSFSNEQASINVSDLAEGIYFIRLYEQSKLVFSNKFLKE